MGFLDGTKLGQEAALYGDVGGRPQVVWPNGLLASTAVGIAVDLLTDWTKQTRGSVYLSYDGNRNTLKPHPRLGNVPTSCPHYAAIEVGRPTFRGL